MINVIEGGTAVFLARQVWPSLAPLRVESRRADSAWQTRAVIDIDEFMSGCRPAVRGLVGQFGGAEAALEFDTDPLSAVGVLDGYVQRLPLDEFEAEDWIALHTDLSAFVTVVLLETYGGACRARLDDALPTGWELVVDVVGSDARHRVIAPMSLVYEYLVPVPQRIPRLMEAVAHQVTG
ncbi:hypothetical protein [Streptomyces sp. NBC_00118]|uniref:hypothetical protein n=1 Tax=unclassified Streptomyces TaxID=2593676 RepID=UPI00308E3B8B|nr:hypothetical protein OG518_00295 [Streptomyces sp. NBC_01397]WSE19716.1 hypothetical protein OG518_44145 [Streptomyces sp. NBC_01397]